MNKFSINQKTNPIKYLCILAFTLCTLTTTAQTQQTITGTVSDTQGTLPGVTVLIKGKTTGTLTDENGYFSIPANPTDVLVFSYMGYKTQEINVSNQTTLNIQLEEDTTQLKEVILNAGYYSVKDKERTGSISRITAKEIETQPVTNVLATMQGRMAGVNIVQETGVPGGGFNIQIRGQNSLRTAGNQPLFIVDGVPYASDPLSVDASSTFTPSTTSPLNSLNPDQIQSIEVLKDADATAIYGSRGANGVILITTKKAKSGKTRFTGRMSSGIGQVTGFVKMMNTEQYLNMREQAFANDGITTYPASAYDINGTWDQTRYTDWQKVLLGGTAEIIEGYASVSGGSENTQYMLSGNLNKQTTVFPGSFNYKKGNVFLNINHQSEDKKFRSVVSVGYTIQDNDQPASDLTVDAIRLSPNAPALYDENGNLNWENNTFTNPLRKLNGKFLGKTYDLLANASLSYQITPKLSLKSNIGYTTTNHNETSSSPNTIHNPSFGFGGEYSSNIFTMSNRKSWIFEPQINWQSNLLSGNIDVLLGATFQNQIGNTLVQNASGFASPSLIYNLAAATNIFTFTSQETIYKYQAFFGRINYNLSSRYIINLTGRRDGSSRFGPGKQFSNFGAIGAAWLLSEESFLKDNKILSFAKIRTSYGITGSDLIGDYQYINTYATTGINYNGIIGLQPTRLFNPDFGWETNKKMEIALETGFLNDRILLTAEWYKNRSSNQLVGIPLPGTTGFNSVQANLGATVQNKGIELSLTTQNIKSQNLTWSTSINLTQTKNKLVSFPNLEGSTYAGQYVIGEPVNIRRLYHFTGVNPETGLYTFEDVNNDGIFNNDDKKITKDLNPKYFGGLQNQIKYKNLQLDFLFQFVKQENYNPTAITTFPGNRNNQPVELVNSWQQVGDNAPYQLFTNGSNGAALEAFFRFAESDRAISDASFIRLKNISLAWDVPKEITKGVNCRFTIQGQNLLTFTKYKGADPEFTTAGYLPPLKIYTASFQFSF
jgi:TonB-linked SusC/RagA family outer membrane protein